MAIISIVVAAVFYLRRRRSQAAFAGVGASQPILNDGIVAQPSLGPSLTLKLYDPDDPTTFPGYQAGPWLPDVPPASQVTLPSSFIPSKRFFFLTAVIY
ncbi:hypothetical protein BGY98DRAFT_965886 [Russula aff. rugulosa BPL654]|nr:hypothetical protein BGY98DRAFT_965886 [Russula aff. rugulosa BPL654]